MGYYTRHELTIVAGNDNKTDYETDISNETNYDYLFEDEIKWYDCDSDMLNYSLKHPQTTFMIEGWGEEQGDIWRAWYKNGRTHKEKAKIVFEDFNESKLK